MREGAIEQRMARELDSLREQSQFRGLEILDGAAGSNLSSNDYLGLARPIRGSSKRRSRPWRARSGSGSTGSRLLSGNSREWEEIESEFAAFAGTEAALYFSSGYAANIGLLASLLKPSDTVFSDALNHASLIDGIRLSRRHESDLSARRSGISRTRAARCARTAPARARSSAESVFSMEGDVAPVTTLLRTRAQSTTLR